MRLCYLLLEQSCPSNDKLVLPSYFTYEELSKFLCVHSVTISRIMSRLKQHGNIEKLHHHIIVKQPDQLIWLIEQKIDLGYPEK